MKLRVLAAVLAVAAAVGCASVPTAESRNTSRTSAPASSEGITEKDLAAARRTWGDALVGISRAYEAGGIAEATKAANAALDAAYGYDIGPVLFKPTLTTAPQTYRTTREGALAYFVGADADYPTDNGFALKGWRSVESETAATFIDDDVAMWMGAVRLTDKNGRVTTVDKSWGYKRDADGDLKIVLHHSSLPYSPN